jgi:hypothetical protein
MLTKSDLADPWSQTVRSLGAHPAPSSEYPRASSGANNAKRRRHAVSPTARGSPLVRVVDRLGIVTISVVWRDPTSCCYGAQIWRASVAARSGQCALTGVPIKPGDAVYRPSTGRALPANAGAMILAQEAEHNLPDCECRPLENDEGVTPRHSTDSI